MMRQGDLARPRHAPAADQAGRGDRVVGRPEGPPDDQRRAGIEQAGDRVDARDARSPRRAPAAAGCPAGAGRASSSRRPAAPPSAASARRPRPPRAPGAPAAARARRPGRARPRPRGVAQQRRRVDAPAGRARRAPPARRPPRAAGRPHHLEPARRAPPRPRWRRAPPGAASRPRPRARPWPAPRAPGAGARRAPAPRRRPRRPGRPGRAAPSAARIASAIGRSYCGPAFLRSAGARLATIRRGGTAKTWFASPERTRSRASCTAVSGSPTIENPGSPARRSTSTWTVAVWRPITAGLDTRATTARSEARRGVTPPGAIVPSSAWMRAGGREEVRRPRLPGRRDGARA